MKWAGLSFESICPKEGPEFREPFHNPFGGKHIGGTENDPLDFGKDGLLFIETGHVVRNCGRYAPSDTNNPWEQGLLVFQQEGP